MKTRKFLATAILALTFGFGSFAQKTVMVGGAAMYPNKNIIEILPVENISMIDFKVPTFYSKDIREIGSVIANTDLFIGADSGIMHLASAVQTPTIGLFSVSNLKKYEPYDNCSIGVDVNLYTKKDYSKIINSILNNGKLNTIGQAI